MNKTYALKKTNNYTGLNIDRTNISLAEAVNAQNKCTSTSAKSIGFSFN